MRKIHYRVLRSEPETLIRQRLRGGNQANRIARAIAHLGDHYHEPVEISDLAELASMSVTTVHEHFRSVTGTTPIQLQKDLRMQAARELPSWESEHTVADLAFDVGYESASQFSREYLRESGRPASGDRTT